MWTFCAGCDIIIKIQIYMLKSGTPNTIGTSNKVNEVCYMELYKMLPYLVTIIVLVAVSMRKKRENEPPAALGLAYFREERSFQSSTVFAVELCYYALLAATGRVFMPQGGKKHVV